MKMVVVTRFNQERYDQNKRWRDKNKVKGCIYGSPVVISPTIPINCKLFVIEMNNEANKIEGIGYIRKPEYALCSKPIYKQGNYNRYVYVGDYRINIDEIEDKNDRIVMEVLERLLFKGSRHSKRGHGLSSLPKFLQYNKYNFNFAEFLKSLFEIKYGKNALKRKIRDRE